VSKIGLTRRREEIGRTLAGEAREPIRDALTEAHRAAMTFHVASEEARRLGGEVVPLDLAPHGKGSFAIMRGFPLGPVSAISRFNFPLNLSAHKLERPQTSPHNVPWSCRSHTRLDKWWSVEIQANVIAFYLHAPSRQSTTGGTEQAVNLTIETPPPQEV